MWTPIEDAEIQRAASDSISGITDELLSLPVNGTHSFMLCERALLYTYLALEHPGQQWQEKSMECLNAAIDGLASSSGIPNGLYGGLAGIGWMIEHISSLLLQHEDDAPAASDDEDVLSDVDEHLVERLTAAGTSNQNYDLISGVVGTGVYWLARLPRKRAIHGIGQCLDYLNWASQPVGKGVTWFTPPSLIHPIQKQLAPKGFYNLGVAHGVPGIIGFLAQAASMTEYDWIADTASQLLIASIDWLLTQRCPVGSPSRYSDWLLPDRGSGSSRLGWCYGDLGIAAILHLAGSLTKREAWESEALEMARECASRRADTRVVDAPLCHGAFGVAHVFNRFYNSTRDNQFEEAAVYWVRKGLAFRQANTGFAGYAAWDPDPNNHLRTDASFLSGAVGIALCLLSLRSFNEPKWDRLMLLSGV